MKLILAKQERYIPSAYKNKTLDETEQVAVHVTFPPVAEIRGLRRFISRPKTKDVCVEYDYHTILDSYVGAIENLSVEVDGKAVEVLNGPKLALLPGLQDLVDELCIYITGRSPTEAAKKN